VSERQSPVDIPEVAPRHGHGITWHYGPIPLVRGTNDWAVQFDSPGGISVQSEGQRFELQQFHFHCPGEHTFAGRMVPMELHFVHADEEAQLLVIGVQLVEGRTLPGLDPLVEALGGERPEAGRIRSVDLEALLPARREFVAYEGSLTTPPFTEGVQWRLLTTMLETSAAQLWAFERVRIGNNRPIQPAAFRRFF
jgi:carbonic anhydrase